MNRPEQHLARVDMRTRSQQQQLRLHGMIVYQAISYQPRCGLMHDRYVQRLNGLSTYHDSPRPEAEAELALSAAWLDRRGMLLDVKQSADVLRVKAVWPPTQMLTTEAGRRELVIQTCKCRTQLDLRPPRATHRLTYGTPFEPGCCLPALAATEL